MKKSQRILLIIFSFFIVLGHCLLPNFYLYSYATDGEIVEYDIYDEEYRLISTKSYIEEGDSFITSDFNEYEIYKIEGNKGYAKKIREIQPPKINRRTFPQKRGVNQKRLGLYMTHNDESYTLSDGYDSIYGAGGIHDVAKVLGEEFASRGIDVTLDETLHIPHDSSAYSRSGVTAKRLMGNECPDALFDIHRDGVSRKYYIANVDGKDFSKVRIVVGKSNPNYKENYEFAQKVFALGASMYPWLFLDIYSGKGHYNQSLQNTNLLFEMGTYLIEKDFVYNSIPYLVDVVETALYDSFQNGEDEIIVDDKAPETNDIITENNKTQEESEKGVSLGNSWVGAMILSFVIISLLGFGGFLLIKKSK